jgi:hypothetical protein
MPGEVFEVGGHTAFLILPKPERRVAGMPWVWYAPTLPGLPGAEENWMFEKFLDAGIAIAGIDIGESYGSPDGRAIFTSFHRALVGKRRFSKKPCLLARSRGGLMLYNWAVEHPESVTCIAGIYPVCDLRTYPGIDKASGAYGMTPEQLAEVLARHNPVDRVEPLAKARVPVFHIHGDVDRVVPLELNSAELALRYRRFGGEMTLRVIKGQGHNMWTGWFECQELVDFVIAHAKAQRRTAEQSDKARPKRSYSTRFHLDEDPISEGGKWLNGGKDGIDCYNVVTQNGIAHGSVSKGAYTDPTALLAGSWGKNQKVKARVFSRNPNEKYYQEVEIRLRSTLSPHRCTGYEVFWRCLKTPNAYVEIVRWNGKVGDWTSLKKLSGAQYGVKDGDLVEATITGNVIKGFIHGVEVISVTDDTYTEGSPGMGFNFGVGDSNGDFGFASYEVDTYDE